MKLIFLDVHDRSVKSADMNGTVRTEIELPFLPGALDVLANGQLLVVDAGRQKLYRLNKASQELAGDLSDTLRSFLSDAIVTTDKGTYIGNVGFDYLDPLVDPVPHGGIFFVDHSGNVTLVATDLFFPNGMVMTEDAKTLIVAEMLGHRLTAFEVAVDGSLGNRRLWAQLPDDIKPDGICIDCEGAIWAAATTSRAVRILEGGRIVEEVIAGQGVFAVVLGGPQNRDLILCTSPSFDPVITRSTPGACINIVEVAVAGVPGDAIEARHYFQNHVNA